MLWDYESAWAVAGPCMPSSAIDYATAAHTVHRLLRDRGITCDVVHPDADLSAYRVVVVPTLYLVSDAQADAVRAAAEAGAHVLVTYFSGISDPDDHVRLGGYPGAFRELLGIRVEEFFPLRVAESVALSDGGSGSELERGRPGGRRRGGDDLRRRPAVRAAGGDPARRRGRRRVVPRHPARRRLAGRPARPGRGRGRGRTGRGAAHRRRGRPPPLGRAQLALRAQPHRRAPRGRGRRPRPGLRGPASGRRCDLAPRTAAVVREE